jgi:tyrosyl-tRNA synthetase
LTVQKLVDFQAAGARIIVLLADLHAYLNDKGTLEEIRRVAEYNRHCFISLGLDPKRTEFLLGSDFQLKPEFSLDVLRMAVDTTLLRARRSMAEIARHLKDPDVAQVLYPLMQAVDMARLDVDVAVGGIDQRKVHMVAREKLPALGYRKPVCVHMPLLHGLDGAAKMSSSKGNFIAIDDEPATIEEKVKKAFCPPKIAKDNPIIEYVEHIVLPALGRFRVSREAKHGGPLEIERAAELRKLYETGKLHPTDLKAAVGAALVQVLEPVRRYFEEHSDAKLARPSEVL